jgi:heme-degrading monooxygenase HmoA
MIVRIVKISLMPGKRTAFMSLFSQVSQSIREFKGCRDVMLLKDISDDNIAFTYSLWESEEDLENYRRSELFNGVWSKAKLLFEKKAEAWSLEEIIINDNS